MLTPDNWSLHCMHGELWCCKQTSIMDHYRYTVVPYLLDQMPRLLIAQFCAAFIRERRLLSSVLSVKSLVIVRALRKASFIKKNPQTSLDSVRSCTYRVLVLPFETRGLFTCACATRILAAASIRERRLFRSACLELRLIESGVWSSKYSMCLWLVISAVVLCSHPLYFSHYKTLLISYTRKM